MDLAGWVLHGWYGRVAHDDSTTARDVVFGSVGNVQSLFFNVLSSLGLLMSGARIA